VSNEKKNKKRTVFNTSYNKSPPSQHNTRIFAIRVNCSRINNPIYGRVFFSTRETKQQNHPLGEISTISYIIHSREIDIIVYAYTWFFVVEHTPVRCDYHGGPTISSFCRRFQRYRSDVGKALRTGTFATAMRRVPTVGVFTSNFDVSMNLIDRIDIKFVVKNRFVT